MPRVSAPKETPQAPEKPAAPTLVQDRAARAARKRDVDAVDVPSGKAREFTETNDLDGPEIEVVNGGVKFADKAEQLAFMNEDVEIIVHRGPSKNPEPIIQLACNGRNQFVVRNRKQTVKRRYVEVLVNAREISYIQEEYVAENGERRIRNIPQHGLRYPFTVTRDTDRGAAWLEQRLAEVY